MEETAIRLPGDLDAGQYETRAEPPPPHDTASARAHITSTVDRSALHAALAT